MKSSYNEYFDVGIIGAGVIGLFLAKKLGDLGYRVALVEETKSLANGPSIKNHGWLHRGTYHVVKHEDPEIARRIAKRLNYGYEQIRTFAPEAIEEPDSTTYAITKSDEIAQRAISRWEETDIPYKSIPLGKFSTLNPGVNLDEAKHAFEVADLSINNRILFQKILNSILRNGSKIFVNSKFLPEDNNSAILENDDTRVKIKTDFFVITTGYKIADLFSLLTGQDLPIRY